MSSGPKNTVMENYFSVGTEGLSGTAIKSTPNGFDSLKDLPLDELNRTTEGLQNGGLQNGGARRRRRTRRNRKTRRSTHRRNRRERKR